MSSVELQKYILAVITTNASKIGGGAPVFLCESKEEMEFISANLEAILDGIAHGLGGGDVYYREALKMLPSFVE